MKTAEEILRYGVQHIEVSGDDKVPLRPRQVARLINNGADVRAVNEKQIGGLYAHRVKYYGVRFFCQTKRKL